MCSVLLIGEHCACLALGLRVLSHSIYRNTRTILTRSLAVFSASEGGIW